MVARELHKKKGITINSKLPYFIIMAIIVSSPYVILSKYPYLKTMFEKTLALSNLSNQFAAKDMK